MPHGKACTKRTACSGASAMCAATFAMPGSKRAPIATQKLNVQQHFEEAFFTSSQRQDTPSQMTWMQNMHMQQQTGFLVWQTQSTAVQGAHRTYP